MMEAKKPTALFIGRFQPFHKGHLLAVKWIAKRSGKVIIAIGSAQKSHGEKNPLTAKERVGMIKAQIAEEGLGRKCSVLAVKDVPQDSRWVAYVDTHAPCYDAVYSNNALVKKLMRKAGKKVLPVPFFKREKYNATKIRGMIRKKGKWQARVPEKISYFLSKLGIEKRLE